MISELQTSYSGGKEYRIIAGILFCEILIFFISGLSLTTLHGNEFFTLEQDFFLWPVYYSGIPQAVLKNNYLPVMIDGWILIFTALLVWKPLQNKIALLLLPAMLILYCILTGYLTHRNYQSGYLLVLLPFLFNRSKNRQIMYECCRYFLLFFYVSAAYFKLKSGALFHVSHVGNVISNQFTTYFAENNLSLRTQVHLYILEHKNFAAALFVAAFLGEASTVIGFFTRRFDRIIFYLIIAFHTANWFIMDIAPVGHLAFISLLFFSRKLSWQAS